MSGIISDNVLKQSGLIKASAGGAWTFLSKVTASSSSDVSFTSGIDSTYGVYVFTFNNIHPATDGAILSVNFRDGSTAYDATKTSTFFEAYQNESGSATSLGYETSHDLAQGTGIQSLGYIGNGNDESLAGTLYLYNPSNTTFVKHFIARMQGYHNSDLALTSYVAGYCNVTAAIDGVQFSMSSGNIDAGDFCLYGITT